MNELRNINMAEFLDDYGKGLLALLGLSGFLALCVFAIKNGYGINLKAAYKDFSAEASFSK